MQLYIDDEATVDERMSTRRSQGQLEIFLKKLFKGVTNLNIEGLSVLDDVAPPSNSRSRKIPSESPIIRRITGRVRVRVEKHELVGRGLAGIQYLSNITSLSSQVA